MTEPDRVGEDQPHVLLPLLTTSAEQFLSTARSLTARQTRAASPLPGWTRAHVLVHLARGADSRVRLLTAARTGDDHPQYPDEESRARDIATGALREPDVIRSDLTKSLHGLLKAIAAHPAAAWDVPVRWLGGGRRPVRGVLWSLLRELEVHHVDLAAGYTPADWPHAFVIRELNETVLRLQRDPSMPSARIHVVDEGSTHSTGDGAGPHVAGCAHDVLAWLTGRTDGSNLTTGRTDTVPTVPAWRR
ncbi:maleylpyruvate isomerase family mycothiol-dependent enzyme [Streptomyces sp. NPDC048383]|uniref:maleylpyruvate isomerase family mycothiol-dependent enzyme n=1 Tax=Streptomyces sp. NPDC048383 TaxID=3155386 RepID=UPI0034413D1A